MSAQIQTNEVNNSSITIPTLWDQKQLAGYLGKSTAWCERARWAGEGPAYIKLGRHVRYKVSDVLKWIESNNVGGAA